ncbi:hypothetical protein [Actinophytocola sediminis]
MKKRAHSSLVAGFAVMAAMVAGCTASPTSAASTLPEHGAALDLLTRSGSYPARQHSLERAEELLVDRCMDAKGWAYPAQPPPMPQTYEERLLGLADRRRVGYGLAETEKPAPPADRYLRQLTPTDQADFNRALLGDARERKAIALPEVGEVSFPGDGCVFEGRTRLFPGILTWARVAHLPEALHNRLVDEVGTTPAYADAMREWRGCMVRRGHHYQLPEDAKDAVSARYQAEGPSDRLREHEIAVAVADAECADQVRLPQIMLDTTKDRVGDLSADEQQALLEVTDAWLAAVTTAENVFEE